MKRTSAIILVLVLPFIALVLILTFFVTLQLYIKGAKQSGSKNITWDECVKTPGAMEQLTFPGKCFTPDGRSAVQPLTEEQKKSLQPPATSSPGY